MYSFSRLIQSSLQNINPTNKYRKDVIMPTKKSFSILKN